MRPLLFLILLSSSVYGQTDELEKELKFFSKGDTAVVFGFRGIGYSKFVIATAKKCKFIEYSFNNDKYYDKELAQTIKCPACRKILDYVNQNYTAISNSLDSGEYLWRHTWTEIRNGRTIKIIKTMSHPGPQSFMGIYINGELKMHFFPETISADFVLQQGGYYYWAYFNLLNRYWGDYIYSPHKRTMNRYRDFQVVERSDGYILYGADVD